MSKSDARIQELEDLQGLNEQLEDIKNWTRASEETLFDIIKSEKVELDTLIQLEEANQSKIVQLSQWKTENFHFTSKEEQTSYEMEVRMLMKQLNSLSENIQNQISKLQKITNWQSNLTKIHKELENLRGFDLTKEKTKEVLAKNEKISEDLKHLKPQLDEICTFLELKDLHSNLTANAEQMHTNLTALSKGQIEIQEIIDILVEKQEVAKSWPRMGLNVEDVEVELQHHNDVVVPESLFELEKFRLLMDEVEKYLEPGQVLDGTSQNPPFQIILPRELERRKEYLKDNKDLRIQYGALKDDLMNLIDETQKGRLKRFENGMDFDKMEGNFDHNERKCNEMLEKLHEVSEALKPSLIVPTSLDELDNEVDNLNKVSIALFNLHEFFDLFFTFKFLYLLLSTKIKQTVEQKLRIIESF